MHEQSTTEIDPLDRIDQSIDIDADARRVFALVSRPGWWINGGQIDPQPDLREEDGLTVLIDPTHGEFRLETVDARPPHYVAFRWLHRLPDDGIARSTLVEFTITERTGGGVTLAVAESGFSRLQKPREEWLQDRHDNTEGWNLELAAARDHLEAR